MYEPGIDAAAIAQGAAEAIPNTFPGVTPFGAPASRTINAGDEGSFTAEERILVIKKHPRLGDAFTGVWTVIVGEWGLKVRITWLESAGLDWGRTVADEALRTAYASMREARACAAQPPMNLAPPKESEMALASILVLGALSQEPAARSSPDEARKAGFVCLERPAFNNVRVMRRLGANEDAAAIIDVVLRAESMGPDQRAILGVAANDIGDASAAPSLHAAEVAGRETRYYFPLKAPAEFASAVSDIFGGKVEPSLSMSDDRM